MHTTLNTTWEKKGSCEEEKTSPNDRDSVQRLAERETTSFAFEWIHGNRNKAELPVQIYSKLQLIRILCVS